MSLRLQLVKPLSKKCNIGGEPLTTLFDLNLKSPAPETNASQLNQVVGHRVPKFYWTLQNLKSTHQLAQCKCIAY